jgi:hypothetical protein
MDTNSHFKKLFPKTIKFLLAIPILLLFTFDTSAQTGHFEYKNKKTKEDLHLELRKDGVFLYTYHKDWNNCVTMGKWKIIGNGKVLLTSDFQLTDYTIEEIEDPTHQGTFITIQSKSKGQSPTSISKIYLNEDESSAFELDGEAGLAMLEQRQRTMAAGSIQDRNKTRNTDSPRFYIYKKNKKPKSITMAFDLKELTFEPTNSKANKFIITTAFAPNAAYYYMKDVEFIYDGKFVYEVENTAKKMKKIKTKR